MALKVRVELPTADELAPYAIAAAGHCALLVVVLFVVGSGGARGGLGPSMLVRLSAPTGARAPGGASPAAATPARSKEKPLSRTPPEPAPRTVSRKLTGATAQPQQLPRVEDKKPAPAPSAPSALPAGPARDSSHPGAPGGSIAGGVAGMAAEDVPGADWYVGLVQTRLQDAWRDRPLLPTGAAPLRVTVCWIIERSGEVKDVEIVTPSGYTPLDSSAMRAVLALVRLPPLPEVAGKSRIRAQFVFELTPPVAP